MGKIWEDSHTKLSEQFFISVLCHITQDYPLSLLITPALFFSSPPFSQERWFRSRKMKICDSETSVFNSPIYQVLPTPAPDSPFTDWSPFIDSAQVSGMNSKYRQENFKNFRPIIWDSLSPGSSNKCLSHVLSACLELQQLVFRCCDLLGRLDWTHL